MITLLVVSIGGILHKSKVKMIGKFLVVSERFEEFDSKRGKQRVRRLALLDQATPAFLNTLDYEPKGDDVTKLPEGSSVGKTVEVGVINIRATFGGRFAIDGKILGTGNPQGK